MTGRKAPLRRVRAHGVALLLAAALPWLGACQSPLTRPFREPTPAERAAERQAAEQEALAAERTRRENLSFEDKLSLADQLQRTGRVDKAALAYLRAHERDPDSPVPQERIGFLQVMRKPEEAEHIFRTILAETPERAASHAGLGLSHYAQGDLEPARASLEQAVELAPDDVLALNTLAVVYDLLDEHERAQHYYSEVQRRKPNDAGASNNLGVSLMLLGKFAEAEAALRNAVSLDPKNRSGWNNLGLALGRQQLYGQALKAFRRGGDEQAARNNLGYMYFLSGDYDDAIREYEAALLEGGPATPTIVKNLDQAVDARDKH